MNGTFHFTNLSMAYNEVCYCHWWLDQEKVSYILKCMLLHEKV